MSDENKAIIRRLAEEVVARGNLAVVPELFADTYVAHDLANPDRRGGVEGARAFVGMLHAGLSDLRYAIEDMIADGDRVMYRWSLRGRHAGPFMGVPPTGRALEIHGVDIFRIEGGKIVESWVVADTGAMLRQLGVIPEPSVQPASPASAPVSGTPGSGTPGSGTPGSGKPVSAVPPTVRN